MRRKNSNKIIINANLRRPIFKVVTQVNLLMKVTIYVYVFFTKSASTALHFFLANHKYIWWRADLFFRRINHEVIYVFFRVFFASRKWRYDQIFILKRTNWHCTEWHNSQNNSKFYCTFSPRKILYKSIREGRFQKNHNSHFGHVSKIRKKICSGLYTLHFQERKNLHKKKLIFSMSSTIL